LVGVVRRSHLWLEDGAGLILHLSLGDAAIAISMR
jgi:hypothetical protein